jgi:hypothetical protein
VRSTLNRRNVKEEELEYYASRSKRLPSPPPQVADLQQS